MNSEKLTDIVNQSGFPLQIGVQALVNQTTNQHGWKVLAVEHAWKNEIDNASGFIDIVLENRPGTSVMLVECKRVLDSSWIFLDPNLDESRRHAKAYLPYYREGHFTHFNWADLLLSPDSPESGFCVVPGQDSKSKPMLERVAGEVVSATEAIASEERGYQTQREYALRMYFSAVVTTAKLRVCTFTPEKVSLVDGKVVDPRFAEVPFVRFRKQLSTRLALVPSNNADGFSTFARAKERTVFVVNAEALPKFLSDFEVSESALR